MTALTDRDLAYRAALGLGADGPLPRAIGVGGSTVRRAHYDTDGGVRGVTGPERTAPDGDSWSAFWSGRHLVNDAVDRRHRADVRATRRGTLSDDELAALAEFTRRKRHDVLGSPYLVNGGHYRNGADRSRHGVMPW